MIDIGQWQGNKTLDSDLSIGVEALTFRMSSESLKNLAQFAGCPLCAADLPIREKVVRNDGHRGCFCRKLNGQVAANSVIQ